MLRICCQAFILLCKSSGLCKLANSPILGALSWQKPLLDVNALFFVALGWVKMFWKGLLEGLKFTQVFFAFFLLGHLPCTVTIIPYSSTHLRQLSFMNIGISWGIWCCLVQLIFSPALPWLICAWLKFKSKYSPPTPSSRRCAASWCLPLLTPSLRHSENWVRNGIPYSLPLILSSSMSMCQWTLPVHLSREPRRQKTEK